MNKKKKDGDCYFPTFQTEGHDQGDKVLLTVPEVIVNRISEDYEIKGTILLIESVSVLPYIPQMEKRLTPF